MDAMLYGEEWGEGGVRRGADRRPQSDETNGVSGWIRVARKEARKRSGWGARGGTS